MTTDETVITQKKKGRKANQVEGIMYDPLQNYQVHLLHKETNGKFMQMISPEIRKMQWKRSNFSMKNTLYTTSVYTWKKLVHFIAVFHILMAVSVMFNTKQLLKALVLHNFIK